MVRNSSRRDSVWWARFIGIALVCTVAVFLAILAPALYKLIPERHRLRFVTWGPFVLFLATVFTMMLRPTRFFRVPISRDWWIGLDEISARLIHALTPVVATSCAMLLLGWVPHYLTWPLWIDSDQFAISAQSWDAGILPYRDQPDFDFPGPIYLFWILGKTAGWGKVAAFNAVDAGFVLALGAALAIWSKGRFGRSLPGLASFFVFLGYYLSRDYSQTGQRDWHAPLFVVLGLLALESWPGRAGRVASAFLTAIALSIRPHEVLFFPALVAGIDEGARHSGEPLAKTLRALAEWSALLAVGLLLVFAPLLLAGVADDFVRSLGIARYGGSYNRVTWASFLHELAATLAIWKISCVVVTSALLTIVSPPDLRRPARTWALALLGALVYKPMSPIAHGYLDHPLILILSINVGILVAWIMATHLLGPPVRLLLLVAVLLEGVPNIPLYCSLVWSVQALDPLVRGVEPSRPPPGCQRNLGRHTHYRWDDYRAVLNHLRTRTNVHTHVANVLRVYPFPAVNGPSARPTPFPSAGGVLWLRWIAPGDEHRFAEALEKTPNSVVVWDPSETRMVIHFPLKHLADTIMRLYQPGVRLGSMEIWNRRPQGIDSAGADGPESTRIIIDQSP